MPKTPPKKYIFIDTNIYRSLFSESEEFSDEFLQLIDKLITMAGITLLMPQQVKDEVERNYLGDWFIENQNSLKNKIQGLDDKINKLDLAYSQYSKKALNQIKKDIQREKKDILKRIDIAKKQFLSPKSGSRVKFNTLLKKATFINETNEIRQAAFFRREKGNPPKDKESKLGDKIIWESLLSHMVDSNEGIPMLIFVARDRVAWKSETSDIVEFNVWLQKEFKTKTKGKVVLVEKLSQIPGLTVPEQQKIKDEEEKEFQRNLTLRLKTSIPERIKTVNSFAGADSLMNAILSRIDYIDSEGVEQILKASLENNDYSAGPYNQVTSASYARNFFTKLLEKSIAIGCDLKVWKDFYLLLGEDDQERFYQLRKKLEEKGVVFDLMEIKYIHPDDIPF